MASLNITELATILAALRNWQEVTSESGGCDPRDLAPDHFIHVDPLTGPQIDELCERLNCARMEPAADAELIEVLRVAVTAVELSTPNGAQDRFPDWAFESHGDIDFREIAKRGRAAIRRLQP